MINLRYHIMSLIAVLLALVLGVAAGSAVVDKGLVNQLEQNLDRLENNLNEASKNNGRLTDQLNEMRDVQREFDQEAGARYLPGILLGVPVLLVAVRGVNEGAVADLSNALTLSGAEPQATVWIEPKAVLADPEDATRLAQALGVPLSDAPTLQQRFAAALGQALVGAISRTGAGARPVSTSANSSTTGPGTTGSNTTVPITPPGGASPTTAPPSTTTTTVAGGAAASDLVTLLETLRKAGFISVDRDKGISTIDLAGGAVLMADSVAVADPGHQPAIAIARELALHPSIPTVVTEIPSDDPKGASLVDAVRSDQQLRARLSTVDDARSLYGWMATALAASQLQRGTVGHYGHGKGADSLLPASSS